MVRHLFVLLISGFLLLGETSAQTVLAATEQQPSADAKADSAKTASGAVVLGDQTVFRIYQGVGALGPDERAAIASGKLQEFSRGDLPVEAIQKRAEAGSYRILAGDVSLLLLDQTDASAAGQDLDDLARNSVDALRLAVSADRSGRSLQGVVRGLVYTLLSAIGLFLAIRLIQRGFDASYARVSMVRDWVGQGLRIKDIEILSVGRLEALALTFLRAMRLLAILLCLYFFVPLTLSFFPVTRRFGAQIFEWFVAPIETLFSTIAGYIPNFFYILVIALVAHYLLKVLAFLFGLIDRGDLRLDWFYPEWSRPTYQIVRVLVLVMAVISAFPYIPGSSSPAFQGVGLVLGLVVSFASSSAISNVIAGVILVYTRAFQIGDRVKIGDTLGDVVEKTLLVTRLRTPKNVVVTVPNSMVLNTHIINYSSGHQVGSPLVMNTTVTIGYDVPWRKVHALLINAAEQIEGIDREPAPFVLQTALNDFYVSYELNAHTSVPAQMPRMLSELHQNIQDAFNAAGVEIMSPHYRAVRDGNETTVQHPDGKQLDSNRGESPGYGGLAGVEAETREGKA